MIYGKSRKIGRARLTALWGKPDWNRRGRTGGLLRETPYCYGRNTIVDRPDTGESGARGRVQPGPVFHDLFPEEDRRQESG